MNTLQLKEALSDLFQEKHVSYGVFARNELPTNNGFLPIVIIFNTDPSTAPGSHWLGIVVKKLPRRSTPTVYFIDSFGQPPSIYNVESYLRTFSSDIRYFTSQMQSTTTATCGAFAIYCTYYLLYRNVNTLDDISTYLTTNNIILNDSLVYNFIKHRFPYFRFPFHVIS